MSGPTVDEIKASLRSGIEFYRDIVRKVKVPPSGSLGDPVDTGYSVLCHNAGPPVYGIIKRSGGEVDKGSYESTGPGGVGYYPIKLKQPLQFLFLDRFNHCTYTAKVTQSATQYKEEVTVTFTDPDTYGGGVNAPGQEGDAVASYLITRDNTWTTSPALTSRVVYKVKRLWANDFTWGDGKSWGGVGWGDYQILDLSDGQEVTVWDSSSNSDPSARGNVCALAEYPVKLEGTVAKFFSEMADYYYGKDEDLHNDLETKAARINDWSAYWQNTRGLMTREFMDGMYDYYHEDGWIKAKSAFWEPEYWALTEQTDGTVFDPPVYSLGLSPYRSHLVTNTIRSAYLTIPWAISPYYACLECVDRLIKGESPSLTQTKLKYWVDWHAGKGVSMVRNFGFAPSTKFGYHTDVYRGDCMGAYFIAVMQLYRYATLRGQSKVASWAAARAEEAADLAVHHTQIEWSGKQTLPDGSHIYLPDEAGGFRGSWKFQPNGEVTNGNWAPYEFEVFLWLLGQVNLATQQFPWPGAGAQAFESSMMCMKGLKMYKELVLGDLT